MTAIKELSARRRRPLCIIQIRFSPALFQFLMINIITETTGIKSYLPFHDDYGLRFHSRLETPSFFSSRAKTPFLWSFFKGSREPFEGVELISEIQSCGCMNSSVFFNIAGEENNKKDEAFLELETIFSWFFLLNSS